MSASQQPDGDGGLSRRQLLTRGAIAGGLVWAAPVIRTTAAYATTANGTERPCTDFFMVTINPAGRVLPQPRDLNSRDVPPAIRQWFADNPAVQVQFPSVLPLLTQTSNSAWAVLLPEISGPNASGRQCRMVIGWDEKRHKYAEAYVDPNPPLSSEVGRRLIFPCPDPGRDDNGGGNGDRGLTASVADTTGTGTADAVVSPDSSLSASGAPSASSAAGTIGSDGANSGGPLSSDGDPSRTVSSDGSPSKTPPKDQPNGAGACINLAYLIYCCPR